MYLSFIHKIALSNFHWERSFSASVALHSLHLLSCTKHSISVLRSSKLVIQCIEALRWLALQKALTHENLSSAMQITLIHEKETSFMYLSFTLKIAFSNFLSLRKKLFSIRGRASITLKIAFNNFSHWERSFFSIRGLAFSSFA